MADKMTLAEAWRELAVLERNTKKLAKVLRAYIRILETQEGDIPDDE